MWKKCKSTSKPGRFYYYNTVTEESRWSLPPEATIIQDKSATGDCHGGCEEDMEIERWGEDEEVGMDVDLTAEEELSLMMEISQTRSTLALTHHTPSILKETASSAPCYTEKLYLVLDTNVLISHLHFLVELKDYAIKGVGRPVLVVPWIVMQELDALKTRPSVGSKVREAISFLHQCFASAHPRVKGQTMEEVQTELSNVAINNNDDRILHCCLLYQHKVAESGGLVVLFSNDTQLCSKAMVNQVRALNRKTLLSELRTLCRHMQEAKPTSYTHTPEFGSRVTRQVERSLLVDDLLCESEAILRDCLSRVVAVEMELAYQELWTTVVVVKPPWTFKDLIHIMDKHWIAVFGQLMERSYQGVLKKLSEHVRSRHARVLGPQELADFIASAVLFLNCFPKQRRYREELLHSVSALNAIATKLKDSTNPNSSCTQVVPSSPTTVSLRSPVAASLQSPATVSLQSSATVSLQSPTTVTVGASLQPLVTLSVAEIGELTSNRPDLPEHQLPWLLNIMLETTRHCLSRLAGSMVASNSDMQKKEAALFMTRLATLLDTFLGAIQTVLVRQGDITATREFRAALDSFMLTCLQLSCPLSLETLCQLLPLQLQLIAQAQGEFSSSLDTLKLLAQQYSL